ncbi:NAD(P)/FAD-dependent oxidoreductase [Aeromicrobium chenweiae]|uniref:Monooxygenase n=1 Tax=Aeromicrobium chenweiae TaxID=2079793 RepID=A0A2S0WLI8_9ACTN|nr:FAD-dependent monooxygenase [Aeromicrobium chenweiae]AWB92130.1 monooxygenase [Aeromicrobium chenweiae]TGN32980.1 monooxygenase [Aeromicrobium chenweiae]
MRDVVVAGGGPVGLITALFAARAGLDVVVREPRRGPVDKACGEGLMPGAVVGLRELGVELRGRPIAGIRYMDTQRSVEAPFRDGAGMGVRRTTLHSGLAEAAAAAGVEVDEAPVKDVQHRGDHVLVDGVPAQFLIAADGLHSPTRRALGLEGASCMPRRYAQRAHAAITPWTDFVEVHWASSGEAYVTPTADGQVGVAILTRQRGRDFHDLLADHPRLVERLDGAPLGRVRGAGPLRQRATGRVRGNALLVGDAAGYVDALTGEGIALGLAQARAAIAAVVDGKPQRYERDWRLLTWRHDLMTTGLVTASRAPLVRAGIVPAAQRLPAVFGWAVNQLARPA